MNPRNDNHKDYFFCISKRSMSLVSAGLLLTFFSIFMTGYVWGKRIALEDVLRAVEQKTFADQISGSLYALSCSSAEAKRENPVEDEPVEVQIIEDQVRESVTEEPCDNRVQENNSMPHGENNNEISDKIAESYCAQLIGFGSNKAAQQFVMRLKNDGIEAITKERISIGNRNKKRVWYQVITQSYTNKEDLERLVAYITKKERLNGVQIVSC